jgi:putative heme iron utilization protein
MTKRVEGPPHDEHAKTIVASASVGSLATMSSDHPGYPFVSIVRYALDGDGNVLLSLSDLAEHATNLAHDDRASLMAVEPGDGDPLASGRATVLGRCRVVAEDERAAVRERYLEAHPDALYVDFKDFKLYRLQVESVRYVGGFGRMSWIKPDAYKTAEPDPVAPRAADILKHCNEDHPDTLVLYCKAYADIDAESAVMTSVDRYGFDLMAQTADGPQRARILYERAVTEADQVRVAMVELAHNAREKLGIVKEASH